MMDNDKIKIAAMILLLSPRRYTEGYRALDMMKLAGIADDLSATKSFQDEFTTQYNKLLQRCSPSRRQTELKEQK